MEGSGLTKEQFNGATGGLISIDEDDDLSIESHTFQRIWRVYSGQLQGTDPSDDHIEQTVKVSSIVTICFSSFFWSWAFFHIFFEGSFDLGFISFVFPIITNFWGWQSTKETEQFEAMRYCKRYQLTPYAHLIVSLNYALGAYSAGTLTARTYCTTFGLFWALTIYFTKNLSDKWFWVLSDREGVGPFRQNGESGAGFGVSSSSSSTNSLLKQSHSTQQNHQNQNQNSSLLQSSTLQSDANRNVFGVDSIDEFDDDTEDFVAEL